MSETSPAAAVHEHPAHLAHHFETPRQQFESGKLGLWLFLTTEILLFSGLFCAYAVYRAGHPEIFAYAHLYLSRPLGTLNTLVLIFSSFTMASAVHAAQVGNNRLLVWLLGVTLCCGFIFLGVKFIEYKDKWEEHLLTGQAYRPESPPPGAVVAAVSPETQRKSSAAAAGGSAPGAARPGAVEKSTIGPAAVGTPGLSPAWLARKTHRQEPAWVGPEPYNVQLFFGIYFAMTGLHGVHVIAGIIAIAWILSRALRGEFSREYFTPVDFTGLYWHLVDLVWIFLFPLFYLIT